MLHNCASSSPNTSAQTARILAVCMTLPTTSMAKARVLRTTAAAAAHMPTANINIGRKSCASCGMLIENSTTRLVTATPAVETLF